MIAHSKIQKSQRQRSGREDEECLKALMEDRLQERCFGQREEKSMTVQGKRTEQNILYGVPWEQMIANCVLVLSIHPQAEGLKELAAATATTPVGFLLDQRLMVHDWSVSLRVTVLLAKLFLMCLINVALD